MSSSSRTERADGARRLADQYVEGADCKALQIGSTPKRTRMGVDVGHHRLRPSNSAAKKAELDSTGQCNTMLMSEGVLAHDLNVVAAKLNTRPRERLGFDTPAARLEALLH